MPSLKFTLNAAGVREILNSAGIREAVNAAANDVADHLEGTEAHDGPVEIIVDEYTSDRAVAGVTIAHAAGIGLEAEHGLLTGAVTSAGLTLGRRK